MDKIITILIVIIGVFLGSYVWYYIMNRQEPVENIETTINGKNFKITRKRKWYE